MTTPINKQVSMNYFSFTLFYPCAILHLHLDLRKKQGKLKQQRAVEKNLTALSQQQVKVLEKKFRTKPCLSRTLQLKPNKDISMKSTKGWQGVQMVVNKNTSGKMHVLT